MTDSIKCPFCSEEINQEAKKCKHCGEFVNSFVSDDEVEIIEQINAFTKAGRQELLEQKKKKLESIGFRFISYTDNGVSGSTATFIGPKDKKPKNQVGQVCLAIFAVIIVISIVFAAIDGGSSSKTSLDDDNVHGAWAYTQQFVEKRLKSPGSAKFPFGGFQHASCLGNHRYNVDSYVDSENSFGAKIRTHFTAIIKETNSGWELESLNMK